MRGHDAAPAPAHLDKLPASGGEQLGRERGVLRELEVEGELHLSACCGE